MTTSFRDSMEIGDQGETVSSPLSLNQEARPHQTCAMYTGDVHVCDMIPGESFQGGDNLVRKTVLFGPFSQPKNNAK